VSLQKHALIIHDHHAVLTRVKLLTSCHVFSIAAKPVALLVQIDGKDQIIEIDIFFKRETKKCEFIICEVV
jgi:hypothetical protein